MTASPSSAERPASHMPHLRWALWGSIAIVGVLAGVLVVSLTSSKRSSPVAAAQPPPVSWAAGQRRAPDFRLVDQAGAPVTLAAYRGRPVIVTFIDPLCRNFCPLEAKQLNELVRRLPAKSRPEILSVSVNVYGDARSNLQQDAAKWQLVPQWRWAVGSDRELAQVWHRYQVEVLVATKKIAGVTVHEITHTEAAYVIDGRGYERALFFWPFSARDVQATLDRLRSSAA
jgi:cytochrome oxidase Cu insertion factor (SCO1/SenC/PrrC family)